MSAVLDKLVSMQSVDIQRRPMIYSTCVQGLSVHTYTRIYTAALPLCPVGPRPDASLLSLRTGHSSVLLNPLAESHLENLPMKIPLSSLWFLLSRHVERMVGGEQRWEERAWEWMWGSSRKPPWVLPRPEVNDTEPSGEWMKFLAERMFTSTGSQCNRCKQIVEVPAL